MGLLYNKEKSLFYAELETINYLDYLDYKAGLPGFSNLNSNSDILGPIADIVRVDDPITWLLITDVPVVPDPLAASEPSGINN